MEEQGFINSTPFVAQQLFLMDESGRDILVVVIKATYRISGDSRLELAGQQEPVSLSGEYYGEPGDSSIKYEPEVAPVKVATDIVLIGHAYPDQRGAGQVDVTLRVGPVQKTVRVFGDRYWMKLMGFKKITSPKPVEKTPLVYELAFGGRDRAGPDPLKTGYEPRNPVGTGKIKPGEFEEGMKLPNIEDPQYLIKSVTDTPPPAGFGFIGPEWEPRSRYAGTYDDNWMHDKMPFLPDDFDRRYYNAAHPGLIAPGYLKGNEQVDVVNASPRGRLRFALPGIAPPVGKVVMKDGTMYGMSTNLDTVITNTDQNIVMLLWRGQINMHRKIHNLRSVKVQMA
ncbi:MAG: DUF2169 domain-containing protein [bacterium]